MQSLLSIDSDRACAGPHPPERGFCFRIKGDSGGSEPISLLPPSMSIDHVTSLGINQVDVEAERTPRWDLLSELPEMFTGIISYPGTRQDNNDNCDPCTGQARRS